MRTRQEIEALTKRVASVASWYHAIDLGDGVITPGPFRMADYLKHYHFPDSLAGKRVLDVGASNGFFAAHFERLGAEEVVALDLPTWADQDMTPRFRRQFEEKSAAEKADIDRQLLRDSFTTVIEELGCKNVRKVDRTIYQLDPADLGTFDLVFCGSMLMHVRDPMLGLFGMRSVCKEDGRLIIAVSTSMENETEPVARFAGQWNQTNWWVVNPPCLQNMLRCADFDGIENEELFVISDTTGQFNEPTFSCHALPRRDRPDQPERERTVEIPRPSPARDPQTAG